MAARLGKATASRIADVIAKTKSGYSTSRKNYAAELVCERLTKAPTVGYTNAAMQRGTELEPEARASYEFFANVEVIPAGYIDHPTLPMAGASPDGFVGEHGLVEIKCPNAGTHIETLLTGNIDGRYITQMQWQLCVSGRQWCDFISYDNRLPEAMRLFIKRVPRDDAMIAELTREVTAFLVEVDHTVAELTKRYSIEKAA
jgi:putative phage-type endonuclease